MQVLERVIPVGARFEQGDRGWIVLGSIELWDDAIAVRFAQKVAPEAPSVPAPPEGGLGHLDWDISDDLGNEYRLHSAGGSGNDPMLGVSVFTPRVDPSARLLRVFAPFMTREIPIEVEL